MGATAEPLGARQCLNRQIKSPAILGRAYSFSGDTKDYRRATFLISFVPIHTFSLLSMSISSRLIW